LIKSAHLRAPLRETARISPEYLREHVKDDLAMAKRAISIRFSPGTARREVAHVGFG